MFVIYVGIYKYETMTPSHNHHYYVYIHEMPPERPLLSIIMMLHNTFHAWIPLWKQQPLDLLYSISCKVPMHGTVSIWEQLWLLLYIHCTQMPFRFVLFIPGRRDIVCGLTHQQLPVNRKIHPYLYKQQHPEGGKVATTTDAPAFSRGLCTSCCVSGGEIKNRCRRWYTNMLMNQLFMTKTERKSCYTTQSINQSSQYCARCNKSTRRLL